MPTPVETNNMQAFENSNGWKMKFLEGQFQPIFSGYEGIDMPNFCA